MTTLNNDGLRKEFQENWGDKCAEYDNDCPACIAWRWFDGAGKEYIATHDQQLLEAILGGLRGKVVLCNTDGEKQLAMTLLNEFEEHIKSVFQKKGES